MSWNFLFLIASSLVDYSQQEKEEYKASHPHLNHSGSEKKPRANEKVKLPALPKSALKFYLEKKTEGLGGTELEESKKRLKLNRIKKANRKRAE